MKLNQKKSTEGFTIIEILIVLVIAGLIMLIVFLAVPALQRNSRNTQRKNDVARLLGAVSENMNNNSGNGAANAWTTDVPTITNLAGTLSFYKNPATEIVILPAATLVPGNDTDIANILAFVGREVVIYRQAACDPANATVVDIGSKIAALYRIEASNGTFIGQCVES